MHMIDTHQMVKDLIAVGIKKPHAEGLVNMVYKSRDYDLSHLSTKEQVKTLEISLKKDIALTKEQVKTLEITLRKDIDLVRKEMEVLRADTKSDIATIKVDILKWIVPLLVAIIAIVAKQAFRL